MLIFHGRENTFGSFDDDFVIESVLTARRVPLDHVQFVAVEISCPVELGQIVETGDIYDERISFPAADRMPHPGINGTLRSIPHVDYAAGVSEFVGDQDATRRLHNLKRKRHVGGAGDAREKALVLGVGG
jgi:hypothetical protein